MKTLTKILLILLVSYLVTAANGASFEVFLKIEGIQGDSKDNAHRDEIDVVSFQIGVLNTGTFAGGGGGGAGVAKFSDLTVFKFIDKASPQLFLASAMGEHIKTATLVVRPSGPNPFGFYTIILDDVLITSVNNAGTTDQNGNLIESISLNCARMTWSFTPRNPDGSWGTAITHFFDLTTGQGG
jgi:type VI secretion system secreted protein Hcp